MVYLGTMAASSKSWADLTEEEEEDSKPIQLSDSNGKTRDDSNNNIHNTKNSNGNTENDSNGWKTVDRKKMIKTNKIVKTQIQTVAAKVPRSVPPVLTTIDRWSSMNFNETYLNYYKQWLDDPNIKIDTIVIMPKDFLPQCTRPKQFPPFKTPIVPVGVCVRGATCPNLREEGQYLSVVKYKTYKPSQLPLPVTPCKGYHISYMEKGPDGKHEYRTGGMWTNSDKMNLAKRCNDPEQSRRLREQWQMSEVYIDCIFGPRCPFPDDVHGENHIVTAKPTLKCAQNKKTGVTQPIIIHTDRQRNDCKNVKGGICRLISNKNSIYESKSQTYSACPDKHTAEDALISALSIFEEFDDGDDHDNGRPIGSVEYVKMIRNKLKAKYESNDSDTES
jgi:hypothetical protein